MVWLVLGAVSVRCVLHRSDHNGVIGDRVPHRGMLAGGGGFDSTVDTK